MEQGGGERAKRIEWVSLVVDVAVCSHFAKSIALTHLMLLIDPLLLVRRLPWLL